MDAAENGKKNGKEKGTELGLMGEIIESERKRTIGTRLGGFERSLMGVILLRPTTWRGNGSGRAPGAFARALSRHSNRQGERLPEHPR